MSRPALSHWQTVAKSYCVITEFIEWLQRHQIQLETSQSSFKLLDANKPAALVDKFLEVDREAMDRERQEMLGVQRAAVGSDGDYSAACWLKSGKED